PAWPGAGVASCAGPQGEHVLDAPPRSTYSVLGRNNRRAFYAPAAGGSGEMLADARPRVPARRAGSVSVARSQSPDHEEPVPPRGRGRGRSTAGDILVPAPSLLGIADPVAQSDEPSPRAVSGTTSRTAWHPTNDRSASTRAARMAKARPSELDRDDESTEGDSPKAVEPTTGAPAADALPSDLASPPAAASRSGWKRVTPVS